MEPFVFRRWSFSDHRRIKLQCARKPVQIANLAVQIARLFPSIHASIPNLPSIAGGGLLPQQDTTPRQIDNYVRP